MESERIGIVVDIEKKASKVSIKLEGKLKIGDKVKIVSSGTEALATIRDLSIVGIGINEGFPGDVVETTFDSGNVGINSEVYKVKV